MKQFKMTRIKLIRKGKCRFLICSSSFLCTAPPFCTHKTPAFPLKAKCSCGRTSLCQKSPAPTACTGYSKVHSVAMQQAFPANSSTKSSITPSLGPRPSRNLHPPSTVPCGRKQLFFQFGPGLLSEDSGFSSEKQTADFSN